MDENEGPFVVACLLVEQVVMPKDDEPPSLLHVMPNLKRATGVRLDELAPIGLYLEIAGGTFAGRFAVEITYTEPGAAPRTLRQFEYAFPQRGGSAQINDTVTIGQASGLHWIKVLINGKVMMQKPVLVDLVPS